MDKVIAYCGLTCTECGAYIATMNDDDEKRSEVAAQWSEEYGGEFTAKDISCMGCFSESDDVFDYCKKCEIRSCAKSRGVANCAHCDEYPCGKLADFLRMVPDAKKQLDAIRASL